MQYWVYHKTGEKKIVNQIERELLIKEDDWFSSPHEAKQAVDKEIESIREEVKNNKKNKKK